MNTRLQVEHPVTEMISGQDLVEWQLRVAAGQSLPLQQSQIEMQGHAFEARIYAESPQRDFMPAAGRIRFMQLPLISSQVRVDTGVRCGDSIGINYDPMIAKLIVHGPDRSTALARLAHALRQFQILGLNTNLDFLGRLVAIPAFRAADFDTGFIGTHYDQLFVQDSQQHNKALLLAAAALLPAFDSDLIEGHHSPWDLPNHWRMNLPSTEQLQLLQDGRKFEIVSKLQTDGWLFSCAQRDYRVNSGRIDAQRRWADIDGEHIEFAVLRDKSTITLVYDGQTFQFELLEALQDAQASNAAAGHPQAPMSGAVVAIGVAVGDRVEAGDTLMVIEAMKMEHAITAQAAATVSEVLFAIGDQVDEGETLIMLEVE